MTPEQIQVAADKAEQRSKVLPPAAGKGRVKGVPNKTTKLLKDAILKAAQQAGGGGDEGLVTYLTTQANTNPGPFMSLLGKVLPMQLTGEGGGPVQAKITLTFD